MEHTLDDTSIRKFIANKGYFPKLREGAIIQCETRKVLNQIMEGYTTYSTLNEPGKMMFTDRQYKRSYNRHTLPKYIYGLVEEVATDASCDNSYYLDIIRVNFYGEHLLKGFGYRCCTKLSLWEYQVEIVRNKTDNTDIDIQGVDEMFKYDYEQHQWIKAVCIYCGGTGCGLMNIYDDVQAVCSVFEKMNVSQCAKRAMLKNWYQNSTNNISIRCVDEDGKARWPVDEGSDFEVAIICRDD